MTLNNRIIIEWIDKHVDERCRGLTEGTILACVRKYWVKQEKSQVRKAGLRAAIRT
jgi:hypothetical protein